MPRLLRDRPMTLPRTAYILLWFPKPSETFIFREVQDLRRFGLELRVFSLYGEWVGNLSAEMRAAAGGVERLGCRALPRLCRAIAYWFRRRPALTARLLCRPFRWGGGCEKWAENFWAFLAGFQLARRCEAEGIRHIHAPWAGGPATAAWVASQLTGIPFTFTARAWDIHPPDAWLREKIRDATFVRCETNSARDHLAGFTEDARRLHTTYNGVPLARVFHTAQEAPADCSRRREEADLLRRPIHPPPHVGGYEGCEQSGLVAHSEAPVPMRPPYQLLAVGRFVRKKGFDQLLHAARRLADEGVDFHLTLAGDGPQRRSLQRLARRLKVAVRFTGFVPHDRIAELFQASDVFVMPSVVAPSGDRDGLPTVLLEALAHRLPVVATKVAGIPELITDGETGLLVPEKDPAALAAAVRRLLADRDAALAMAERGRDRVREQFDPERNHRRVLELYAQLS